MIRDMTRNEILDLLSAVTAYDNREPTEALLAAWSAAAQIARWTFVEALAAVHHHYATSTDYLMPGHVTHWIRAHRPPAAVAEPDGPQQLEQPPASDETRRRVMELVREIAARRAIPTGDDAA